MTFNKTWKAYEWAQPPETGCNETLASDLLKKISRIEHPVTNHCDSKGTAYRMFKLPEEWTGQSEIDRGETVKTDDKRQEVRSIRSSNQLGTLRGQILLTYESEEDCQRQLHRPEQFDAEKDLLDSRLQGRSYRHATRLGTGYALSGSQSAFVRTLSNTSFSVERINTELIEGFDEDAEDIDAFTHHGSSPAYRIKDEDGKVVGGIRDRTVIVYDEQGSREYGKTPRILFPGRPSNTKKYSINDGLFEVLEGTDLSQSDIHQSPPIAPYSGISSLSSHTIADYYNTQQ